MGFIEPRGGAGSGAGPSIRPVILQTCELERTPVLELRTPLPQDSHYLESTHLDSVFSRLLQGAGLRLCEAI